MARVIETIVYTFDELSEDVQQTVINNMRDINVDGDFWHEFIQEDAIEIAELLGITIDKIYFSGFSSQGDGACFIGRYEYKKGSVKAVMQHAPQDKELHAIAQGLQSLQKKYFYQLNARITHNYRYYFAKSTTIDVWQDKSMSGGDGEYYPGNEIEEQVTSLLHNFMDWIYSNLQKEYDYQTSDEVIKETILSNEYEFTKGGKLS